MYINVKERNIIRQYLDRGMSPEAIADHIGRLHDDLDSLDILSIRSAAYDLINDGGVCSGRAD